MEALAPRLGNCQHGICLSTYEPEIDASRDGEETFRTEGTAFGREGHNGMKDRSEKPLPALRGTKSMMRWIL